MLSYKPSILKPLPVAAHDERCGRGEEIDEGGRKQRNIHVRILERVQKRVESQTSLRQTIVALGMEEDFVVR